MPLLNLNQIYAGVCGERVLAGEPSTALGEDVGRQVIISDICELRCIREPALSVPDDG